ncbi:hypothetical protein V8F33_011296 [Rhypophila sp. PSN 637]
MDYHPLFDTLAILSTSSVVIGFTSPSSKFRLGLLPVVVLLAWHCTLACPRYIPRSAWSSSVGGYTLSLLLHYLDIAVLTQWSFDLQGPAKNVLLQPQRHIVGNSLKSEKIDHTNNILQRFRYGLSTCLNWRLINTPHQAANIPRLDPSLSRSRKRFLAHTALTILICYLILNTMDILADADPGTASKFYCFDKIHLFARLPEVSFEELAMRFSATIAMGVSLISVQKGVYCACAFVSVLTGLSDPDDWPPFNGPLGEIVALRSFWSPALDRRQRQAEYVIVGVIKTKGHHICSVFWHQINTHRLQVISSFVLYDVLKLPRDVRRYRGLRTIVIFLVSGLLHLGIDVSSGMSLRESGAMSFFMIQPLGLYFDDQIHAAIGAPFRRMKKKQLTFGRRMLGLIWVCQWMTWTTPVYLYPVLAKAASSSGMGNNRVVPFDIIGYCIKGGEILVSYARGTGRTAG